ncbi:MAG: hypothetical protein OXG91_15105 [bacterium]|nr:hypothetical protein [bacterium]MCY3953104.1 hypothetical protein [bacterium]
MDDDFDYPADRLAELLAAAEEPLPPDRELREAPPELLEAIQRSAMLYFAEMPESEQVYMLRRLPAAERDAMLTDLPPPVRDRLEPQLSAGLAVET